MSDDLKKRLMMNWPSNPRSVVYDPIDLLFKEAHDRIEELETLIKELFRLLDITEQTDDSRLFRPNRITILAELKRSITANDKPDA